MDNLTAFKVIGFLMTATGAANLIRYRTGATTVLVGLGLMVADDYSTTCLRLDEDLTAFFVDGGKMAVNIVDSLLVGGDHVIRHTTPHP